MLGRVQHKNTTELGCHLESEVLSLCFCYKLVSDTAVMTGHKFMTHFNHIDHYGLLSSSALHLRSGTIEVTMLLL